MSIRRVIGRLVFGNGVFIGADALPLLAELLRSADGMHAACTFRYPKARYWLARQNFLHSIGFNCPPPRDSSLSPPGGGAA